MNTQTAAQLWIGSPHHLEQYTITFLQKLLCSHDGCATCSTCTHISKKQHHQVMWLNPEKNYTTATLEPLFEKIAFANDECSAFFFILQKSDTLSPTCANSLLKSIEEPPKGYHFILLAERLHTILPTIRSRCIVTIHQHNDYIPTTYQELISAFKNETDPHTFLNILMADTPDETESLNIIDHLLAFWTKQYTHSFDITMQKKILLLQQAIKQPPMPGSSKIFWRNLFLHWW
jgi:hypothetical protein